MRMAAVAIVLAALVIYGEETKPKTDTHGHNSTDTTQQTDGAGGRTVIVVQQQTPEGQQESHPGQTPHYLTRLFSPENIPSIALVFVGIAGIITAIYTLRHITKQAVEMRRQRIIMRDQFRMMRKQLKEMRAAVEVASDTAQKQLRAYVCVSGALLKFKRPDVPEIQVHFSNYGQTPAYDVRSWIHLWIETHPLRVTLPEPPDKFQMSTAVLAPGGRPHIHVIEKKPPVPLESVGFLGTLHGTIYAYGEIRYRDIFKKEQITKYRLIYGGPGGVRTFKTKDGTVSALLKTDTDGNEAT